MSRTYECDVSLEMTIDGFEHDCSGEGPYKRFGPRPADPVLDPDPCTSVARHAGERVDDTRTLGFHLEDGRGWRYGPDNAPRYYCGDTTCP